MEDIELITILGPTASGKTSLAVAFAQRLNAEIISADSRQVYRGMDIGTGKDLSEYFINGRQIPYHLIDILDAGEKYNLFEFQHDFHQVFSEIKNRNRLPVLCGGTGLYIEAVLKGYKLPDVPENPELRESLKNKSLQELTDILSSYGPLHNTTDIDSARRAIRAIEIAAFTAKQSPDYFEFPPLKSVIFGVNPDRDIRRQKITARLKQRLNEGMIEEVRGLIQNGVHSDDLMYYGLEYKYVTQFVLGEISYNDMYERLEIAIHQFAKRQMTWFRGMERRGFLIHWIPFELTLEEKVEFMTNEITNQLNV